MILAQAFPSGEPMTTTEDDPLWADPGARRIFEAVSATATALEGVLVGRRKGFTAFSRRWQFAAARPLKAGGARLAVAVAPGTDPRLAAHDGSTGSERLKAMLDLASPQDVEEGVAALIRRAWAAS